MADMIKKIFTTAVKSIDSKPRVLEFVGSTESLDRDGEVIKADAWQIDHYSKNPVVQWAHKYDEPPIGKTLSIQRRGAETVFEIEFAPAETCEFADKIYKLCKGGFLNATSVGFIPIEFDRAKKEGEPARTFTKVELLEISIVPVPSNPDALVSARDAGIITTKDIDRITGVAPKGMHLSNSKPGQAEIKDELDYCLWIIKSGDLNPENIAVLKIMTIEIKRLVGDDTPIKIEDEKEPVKQESLKDYLEQEILRQLTEV